MKQGWRHLRAYLRFRALPADQRRLVVYSEGPAYWPHLGPVVEALLERHAMPLAYVSSSERDPGVQVDHPRLSHHVIGDGHVRTLFFSTLDAQLLLMTMPDLNTFHIRRAAGTRHYAYLHHSLVSSHMIYRDGAFDHFDTVLCAGPHHETELRAIEALKGLRPKRLVPHGYGRLDTVMAAAAAAPALAARPSVLVAPSWGPSGLLEQHAEPLMASLSALPGWDVVVRPHPQTVRLAPAAMACVERWCAQHGHMRVDRDVAGHGSLQQAHVMISDWSGAAFDFALGLERPVLFVDVPRKVNNPGYERVGIEPIEVFAREQLGQVVGLDALGELPAVLEALVRDPARTREAARAFRERWVWNPGQSAAAAADWVAASLS